MKLCVYAICKNESKYIDRWVKSLQGEADCVVVLDTGSTDDSVEKLKVYEPFVKVEQFDYFSKLGYFRFDKARNDSLKLVPNDADICVILDLDHIPRPGWGNLIKSRFEEGYNEVYGYIVDHDSSSGIELDRWTSKNVHPNSPFWIWKNIIHEGIDCINKDDVNGVFDENFIIDHYPDESKDRSLYRSLLEYACKEEPENPYYGIYLGIELSRRYSKEEAADAFRRCIEECNFEHNKDIHIQTYVNLASMTIESDPEEAIDAITEAIQLGTRTRRMYKLLADAYENLDETDNAINALKEALTIESYSSDWRDDYSCFDGSIEDRLSLFYYYKKDDPIKAMEYCAKALSYHPDDNRLRVNMKFYYEKFLSQVEKENN